MSSRQKECSDVMPAGGYSSPPLVGIDGLPADAMPLGGSDYDVKPRNGNARLDTLENTGYTSVEGAGVFVGVDVENRDAAAAGQPAPVETTLAKDDPELAGLTGAALARAVLVKRGIFATNPDTRQEEVMRRRASRIGR